MFIKLNYAWEVFCQLLVSALDLNIFYGKKNRVKICISYVRIMSTSDLVHVCENERHI